MLLLALDGEERLKASRVELDREGPSYTADTLRRLRESYGDAARLFFICGADALAEMDTWYRPDLLLASASVAVARRPGCGASSDIPAVGAQLIASYGGEVVAFDAPLIDISSTTVRELVRRGMDAGHTLPPAVYQYVLAHGLY
jgi:nicotinate-nucleotide adenylyltransferase